MKKINYLLNITTNNTHGTFDRGHNDHRPQIKDSSFAISDIMFAITFAIVVDSSFVFYHISGNNVIESHNSSFVQRRVVNMLTNALFFCHLFIYQNIVKVFTMKKTIIFLKIVKVSLKKIIMFLNWGLTIK